MKTVSEYFRYSAFRFTLAVFFGLLSSSVIYKTAFTAPLSPTSGTTSVTGIDSIDASVEAGAVDADISFNHTNAGLSNLRLNIIGAGTTNLGSVSITDGDDAGDITRMTIGFGTADTVVIFNGAVNGDETGGIATAADLDISLDSLNVGAGNTTVQFLSTVDLGQNGSLTTMSDADGTSTLVINATISTGTASIGAESALTLGSGLTSGDTAILASGIVSDGANIVITPDSSFVSGTITVIDSTGSTLTLGNYSIAATSSVLATYELSLADTAADLVLTATAKSSGSVSNSLGVSFGAASALLQGAVATTGDATVAAAYVAADAAGGAAAALAAEQSQNQPDVLAATNTILANLGTQVFSIGSQRLEAKRQNTLYASNNATLAMADNRAMTNKGVWMRSFASYGDQDEVDQIDGYTAVTYGLAGGIDTTIGLHSSIGAAFSYAHSNIEGNGAGNADTDVNSYQLMVYGDYSGTLGYIEGMLAYAYNDIDSARHFTFGGLNRQADADYHSNQFMARVGGGIPLALNSTTFVTPQASLQYTLIETEKYTETGAGALNLTVDSDNSDILLAMAGTKIHTNIKTQRGVFSPQAHVNLMYDLIGDTAQSTSTFTSGGSAFNIEGSDVDRFGVNIGAGFKYTRENIEVSALYDAELKENFIGHSGRVELRLNF